MRFSKQVKHAELKSSWSSVARYTQRFNMCCQEPLSLSSCLSKCARTTTAGRACHKAAFSALGKPCTIGSARPNLFLRRPWPSVALRRARHIITRTDKILNHLPDISLRHQTPQVQVSSSECQRVSRKVWRCRTQWRCCRQRKDRLTYLHLESLVCFTQQVEFELS